MGSSWGQGGPLRSWLRRHRGSAETNLLPYETGGAGHQLANTMPGKQTVGDAWRVEWERIMAHLLLIDDDPDLIAEQVRLAFPRHQVEVAGTGADGLGRVRTAPPDVILLDLRLP